MKKRPIIVLSFISIALVSQLFAKDIKVNESELKVFSAQKFKIDFDTQTEKTKKDIENEFIRNTKLGDSLINTVLKDDSDFKVASRQIAIDIWVQKFIKNTIIKEETVKALYDKYEPNVAATYKLRNILVNSEKKADKIIKILAKYENKSNYFKKFKELVEYNSFDNITSKNGGQIGWISINKVDPLVKKSLENAKSKILKVKMKDRAWQILLIEDSKKEQKATYQQSKEELMLLAKQELLKKEIMKILEIQK